MTLEEQIIPGVCFCGGLIFLFSLNQGRSCHFLGSYSIASPQNGIAFIRQLLL